MADTHIDTFHHVDDGGENLQLVAYADGEFRVAVNNDPRTCFASEYILLDRWHALALREFLDHHLKDA